MHYPSSGTHFHAYVAVKQMRPGEARQIMVGLLGWDPYLKTVIAVDEDVDVTRDEEVLWALATHFQPHSRHRRDRRPARQRARSQRQRHRHDLAHGARCHARPRLRGRARARSRPRRWRAPRRCWRVPRSERGTCSASSSCSAPAFLGAAATGKLVPHARWLTENYDVSLGLAGFAISAVMLPGAVLSAGLGVVTDRLGARTVDDCRSRARRARVDGARHASAGFGALIALRLVEGLGYCLLAVGATVLVVEVSTGAPSHAGAQRVVELRADRLRAGPVGGGSADRRRAASPASACGMALLLIAWRSPSALVLPAPPVLEHGPAPRFRSLDGLRHPPALLASLAFGCVTGVLLAAVAVTPLVLARSTRCPSRRPRGSPRWRRCRDRRPVRRRLAAGLAADAARGAVLRASAGALTIALVLVARLPLPPALALFTLFQILMGIIPGVLSAMIPHVAPARDQIGTVPGLDQSDGDARQPDRSAAGAVDLRGSRCGRRGDSIGHMDRAVRRPRRAFGGVPQSADEVP